MRIVNLTAAKNGEENHALWVLLRVNEQWQNGILTNDEFLGELVLLNKDLPKKYV